jgi:hypothetical protein
MILGIAFISHYDSSLFLYSDTLRAMEFANIKGFGEFITTPNGNHYIPFSKAMLWLQTNYYQHNIFLYHFTSIFLHSLIAYSLLRYLITIGNSESIAFIVGIIYASSIVGANIVAWKICQASQFSILLSISSFITVENYFKSKRLKYLIFSSFLSTLAIFSFEYAALIFIYVSIRSLAHPSIYRFTVCTTLHIIPIILYIFLSRYVNAKEDLGHQINYDLVQSLMMVPFLTINGLFLQLQIPRIMIPPPLCTGLLVFIALFSFYFFKLKTFNINILISSTLMICPYTVLSVNSN